MTWETLRDDDELMRVRRAGVTGYWWVLGSTDLVGGCGEAEAAEISGSKQMPIMGDLNLVPERALVSEEQQKAVLESCGWEDLDELEESQKEMAWLEMANSYGLRIPIHHAFGGTNESALRRTLKEACVDLDGSVEHHLDRTINRIGQTGREHLADDMKSCFDRAARRADNTDEQKLCAQLSNAPVRITRQGNLSGECWMVQIYGLDTCKTCEYRSSAECGGKTIRKTGKNEHGHKVPVS